MIRPYSLSGSAAQIAGISSLVRTRSRSLLPAYVLVATVGLASVMPSFMAQANIADSAALARSADTAPLLLAMVDRTEATSRLVMASTLRAFRRLQCLVR